MEGHNELLENTEEMKAAPTADGGEANESLVSTEAYEGHAEPEKVFCVKCGAEIAPGNAFCPKCGHKVGEKITAEDAKGTALFSQNGKNKLPMIAGIAAAVVALIVIFIVVRGPQAKNVTLNKKELSVKAGETASLSYTIDPADTKNKTVTWSTSNESIAQVSGGTITGVNEGDCTITVTTKNGKTDTCSVTVLPAGPDLQGLYNDYCSSSFADLASDGSYLYVDTNPSDKDDHTDYEAYLAIMSINEALGLPESVLNRMNQTRSLDGVQSYSTDDLEIMWSYHPDRGLEVSYTLR